MTTTQPTLTAGPATTEPLRRVIWLDVAACGVLGLGLLGLARPVADLLDIESSAPIVAAGAFLAVLAVGLVWLARASTPLLLRLTPWSAAGDVAWAVASVALAAAAPLSGVGRVLVAAQGLAVAGMAVAKTSARRHAGR